MIFFKINFLNLSDIDQAQHTLCFKCFSEKFIRRKGKNPILVFLGLRYAHKKIILA